MFLPWQGFQTYTSCQEWYLVGPFYSSTQSDAVVFPHPVLFLFLAIPTGCGSSWARDRILGIAVTYTTAVATLDP